MLGRTLRTFATAGLLPLLAGCATFQLVGTWQNPSVQAPHFSSVVVLATARETTARNMFEDAFVGLAQSHGVQAIQGYNVVQENQTINAQELEAGIRRSKAQAAVVVTVIRSSVITETGPTYTDPYGGPQWEVGYWGFYTTGWMEWSATSTTTTVMVQLRINVYEAEGQKLVWSGVTNKVAQDQLSNQVTPLANMIWEALWTRTIVVPAHS
jgi:hypothetical protein